MSESLIYNIYVDIIHIMYFYICIWLLGRGRFYWERKFFYISQKNSETLRLRILAFIILAHSFMKRFLKKIIWMLKAIEGHKSSSNFSVNPTLPLLDGPLMLPPPNCVYLNLSLSILFSLPLSFYYSLSISLFCSMQTFIYTQRNVFHKMRPLLCRVIFKNSQIFW